MAKKRNTGSETGVSGGAAAAAVRRSGRKHAARPAAETTALTEAIATTEPAASAAPDTAASIVEQPAPGNSEPSSEEIARLAYSYWVARGCQGGSPEDDWLRAEQELRNSASTAASA